MGVAEAVSIAVAAEAARRALALPGAAGGAAGPSAARVRGAPPAYSPPTSGASGMTRMDGRTERRRCRYCRSRRRAVVGRCRMTPTRGGPVCRGGGAAWQSRVPPSASSGLGSGMSSLAGAGATCMEVEEDGTGAVEADAGAGLAAWSRLPTSSRHPSPASRERAALRR